MLKELATASALLLMTPSCAPLVGGRPVVTTQSAGCTSLIPDSWRQPVEAPPLPDPTVGALATFADAVLGKLDQANDRTVSTITIVSNCEARDAQAVQRATRRRFLGIFN